MTDLSRSRAYISDTDEFAGEFGLRCLRQGETLTPERATTILLNMLDEAVLSAPTVRWCATHNREIAHAMDSDRCERITVALVPVEDT